MSIYSFKSITTKTAKVKQAKPTKLDGVDLDAGADLLNKYTLYNFKVYQNDQTTTSKTFLKFSVSLLNTTHHSFPQITHFHNQMMPLQPPHRCPNLRAYFPEKIHSACILPIIFSPSEFSHMTLVLWKVTKSRNPRHPRQSISTLGRVNPRAGISHVTPWGGISRPGKSDGWAGMVGWGRR